MGKIQVVDQRFTVIPVRKFHPIAKMRDRVLWLAAGNGGVYLFASFAGVRESPLYFVQSYTITRLLQKYSFLEVDGGDNCAIADLAAAAKEAAETTDTPEAELCCRLFSAYCWEWQIWH